METTRKQLTWITLILNFGLTCHWEAVREVYNFFGFIWSKMIVKASKRWIAHSKSCFQRRNMGKFLIGCLDKREHKIVSNMMSLDYIYILIIYILILYIYIQREREKKTKKFKYFSSNVINTCFWMIYSNYLLYIFHIYPWFYYEHVLLTVKE